jgi:hypothetical protein
MATDGRFEGVPLHQVYLDLHEVTEIMLEGNELQEGKGSIIKLHQEVQITAASLLTTRIGAKDPQETYPVAFPQRR